MNETQVSIPKGKATNSYLKGSPSTSINLFQSPKGRLQTKISKQSTKPKKKFQSPKGRLQTCILYRCKQSRKMFQSPKGRLQTFMFFSCKNARFMFQSPKGRLQTNSCVICIAPHLCFNPQREGYKL